MCVCVTGTWGEPGALPTDTPEPSDPSTSPNADLTGNTVKTPACDEDAEPEPRARLPQEEARRPHPGPVTFLSIQGRERDFQKAGLTTGVGWGGAGGRAGYELPRKTSRSDNPSSRPDSLVIRGVSGPRLLLELLTSSVFPSGPGVGPSAQVTQSFSHGHLSIAWREMLLSGWKYTKRDSNLLHSHGADLREGQKAVA